MPVRQSVSAAVLALLLAAPLPATAAPREAADWAAVVETLRAEGYTAWEEIERDGDGWEVDDAVHADGHRYDLKLSADGRRIVSRDRDD